jgi:hypothetical protein
MKSEFCVHPARFFRPPRIVGICGGVCTSYISPPPVERKRARCSRRHQL